MALLFIVLISKPPRNGLHPTHPFDARVLPFVDSHHRLDGVGRQPSLVGEVAKPYLLVAEGKLPTEFGGETVCGLLVVGIARCCHTTTDAGE